jgi:hypothetical protein
MDEDPFAFFGGLTNASSAAKHSASHSLDIPLTSPDDLLAGFAVEPSLTAPAQGAAPPPPHTRPQQQRQQERPVSARSAASPRSTGSVGSDFGDFQHGSEQRSSQEAQRGAGGSSINSKPKDISNPFQAKDPLPVYQAGHPRKQQHEHQQGRPAAAAATPRPSSSRATPLEQRSPPSSPFVAHDRSRSQGPPHKYRLFDYLDSQDEGESGLEGGQPAQQEERQQRPSPSGGVLGGRHGAPPHAERPAEAVSEMGQKAAKALQSGTRWLMRAGKNLVKEVQSAIADGRGAGHGGVHRVGGERVEGRVRV